MKIGVDIDDVLCEFVPHFFDWHNKVYGTRNRAFELQSYDMYKVFGYHPDENWDRIKMFYATDAFKYIPANLAARHVLEELRTHGHTLYAITSRDKSIKDQTLDWVDKNYTDIFKQVYLVPKKGDLCHRLGIDVHIDDSEHHAMDCSLNGASVVVYDQPWNQHVHGHDRVKNWYEVRELLK